MKSQKKSEGRATGCVAAACYAFSLALCVLVAYAFVGLVLPALDRAGQTLYSMGTRF